MLYYCFIVVSIGFVLCMFCCLGFFENIFVSSFCVFMRGLGLLPWPAWIKVGRHHISIAEALIPHPLETISITIENKKTVNTPNFYFSFIYIHFTSHLVSVCGFSYLSTSGPGRALPRRRPSPPSKRGAICFTKKKRPLKGWF